MDSPKLSDTQVEIVCMIANGNIAVDIARALSYSKSEVDRLLLKARRDLDARNTAHLVSIVIAKGYIEWNDESDKQVVAS